MHITTRTVSRSLPAYARELAAKPLRQAINLRAYRTTLCMQAMVKEQFAINKLMLQTWTKASITKFVNATKHALQQEGEENSHVMKTVLVHYAPAVKICAADDACIVIVSPTGKCHDTITCARHALAA